MGGGWRQRRGVVRSGGFLCTQLATGCWGGGGGDVLASLGCPTYGSETAAVPAAAPAAHLQAFVSVAVQAQYLGALCWVLSYSHSTVSRLERRVFRCAWDSRADRGAVGMCWSCLVADGVGRGSVRIADMLMQVFV
jgi:hypothetical protein